MTPELLKPEEVAERLRIDLSVVYRLVKDGKIGSYTVGNGSVRISENDLDKYLKSRRAPALKGTKKTK